MANQAPPNPARRQPRHTVDEIDTLRGLYDRPDRRHRFGPRQQKHYFMSHADQLHPPGYWQGVDFDLITAGTLLQVPTSVREISAGQTLGLNIQPQRPETSQMTVLDASSPGSGFGRVAARSHLPEEPAGWSKVQWDTPFAASLRRAIAKQAEFHDYAGTLADYIWQSEPTPPIKPSNARQSLRNALDSVARAFVVIGESTQTPELGDRIKYLLPTNVGQNTSVIESDIEETKYQYRHNFLRRSKLADYTNAKLAFLNRTRVAASQQGLENAISAILLGDDAEVLYPTTEEPPPENTALERLAKLNERWATRLQLFSTLETDWDGYGANALTGSIIDRTAQLLMEIIGAIEIGDARVFIAPMSDGGIELDWKTPTGNKLMVVIPPDSENPRYLLTPVTDCEIPIPRNGNIPEDAPLKAVFTALSA